jgi:O-antigen/teichoic acid export membrane protein
MSKARVHVRNLLFNWGARLAGIVVTMFVSPFLVHTLGKVDYGIWSLVVATMGWLGILDIGVRASTGRYVILYVGKGDTDRVNQTIRTSLGLYTILGAFILVVSIGLGQVFPDLFAKVPSDYGALVAILLPLWAINLWLTLFSAALASVLPAYDRFDLARGLDLGLLVIRTTGIVLALLAGYGLLGLTLVYIGCQAVAVVGYWLLAKRVFPALRIWPVSLSRRRLKDLFGYGSLAFVSKIAFKVIGQTDLLVVGILIGVESVTTYSVGAMPVYYSWAFMTVVTNTFFPSVQRAAARDDDETIRWYYLRQMRLKLLLGLPMYIGFILFGRLFITLWMEDPTFGATSVAQAALVMAVLSLSKVINLFSTGGESLLAAKGHIRFTATVAVIEAAVNLALSVSFVLVLEWGLMGIAAGTLAARLLVRAFVIPWRAVREVKLRPIRLLEVVGLGLLAAGLFAGICVAVRSLGWTETWAMFWIQIGLVLVLYVPVGLMVLVERRDRRRWFEKLRLVPAGEP